MKVKKIDHVAILVNNLPRAKKLFSELFETDFSVVGDIKEMDINSIMDPLGIELVGPLSSDGSTAKALNIRGEGLFGLSLEVDDLDEAMAEMKRRSIRLIQNATLGDVKIAVYHPSDLHGVTVELIEYKPKHPTVVAITHSKDWDPDTKK